MMRTSDNIIRMIDLEFSGDWVAYNAVTGSKIFDSRTDGYDIGPILALCPVKWMYIEDGCFRFDLLTEWDRIQKGGE